MRGYEEQKVVKQQAKKKQQQQGQKQGQQKRQEQQQQGKQQQPGFRGVHHPVDVQGLVDGLKGLCGQFWQQHIKICQELSARAKGRASC